MGELPTLADRFPRIRGPMARSIGSGCNPQGGREILASKIEPVRAISRIHRPLRYLGNRAPLERFGPVERYQSMNSYGCLFLPGYELASPVKLVEDLLDLLRRIAAFRGRNFCACA